MAEPRAPKPERAARRTPFAVERGGEVLVVGLGRFGSALARTLVEMGHQVLGVDADPRIVQEHASLLTHTVEADSTNAEVLRQLGADEFDIAVVGIGGDIEASVLTTAALADLGLSHIWAKAVSEAHGRILERVGAHRVVFPEHDMGERVAHLVTGRMMEYIELDENFAIVETAVPRELVGKTLADAGVRARYGVTIVCVKPVGGGFTYATPDTTIAEGDLLLVAGDTKQVQGFAERT